MDTLLIVGVIALVVLGMRRWEAKTALPAQRERGDLRRPNW